MSVQWLGIIILLMVVMFGLYGWILVQKSINRKEFLIRWLIYTLGLFGIILLVLFFHGYPAEAQVKRYSKPELEVIFFQEVERAGKMEHWKPLHAQISQESAWRNWVSSKYAHGLTQFTPPTQGDWYPRTKPSCKGVHWSDPACGVRAQIRYMEWLWNRYRSSYGWKEKGQAGYNGGAGYIDKQIRKCRILPACRHNRWYGNVEKLCRDFRPEWACNENNEYPQENFCSGGEAEIMNVEWLEIIVLLVIALFGLMGWMMVQMNSNRREVIERLDIDRKAFMEELKNDREKASDNREKIYGELKNHTDERGILRVEVALLKQSLDNVRATAEAFNSKLEQAIGFSARQFMDQGDR